LRRVGAAADLAISARASNGSGASMLMSRLPIRLRDRLMKSALGLSEALKAAN